LTHSATACGIGIIATPGWVLPEIAEQGGAILSKNANADAMAAAIAQGVKRFSELGCRARQVIEKNYSLDVARSQWLDLYHATIGASRWS
jgi:glycosyltransferase involved in cell wall biosynthesis